MSTSTSAAELDVAGVALPPFTPVDDTNRAMSTTAHSKRHAYSECCTRKGSCILGVLSIKCASDLVVTLCYLLGNPTKILVFASCIQVTN